MSGYLPPSSDVYTFNGPVYALAALLPEGVLVFIRPRGGVV